MSAWQDAFIDWRGKLDDNTTYRGMDLAGLAVEQVVDRGPNGRRIQLICGGGGVGKDQLFAKILKKRRLPLLVLGTSSEPALVKFAWRHRHARVVVMTDNAKMFTQPTQLDRLKLMTDNPARLRYETNEVWANQKRPTEEEQAVMMLQASDQQRIDQIQRMALRDETIPAPEFDVDYAIIWSSNVNFSVTENIPPLVKPHWDAFLSRGINPRFIPTPPRDLFVYSLHLMLERGMLRGWHMKLDDAKAVLRVLIERRGYLHDVSPRGVRNLAVQRKGLRGLNRLDAWEREVEVVLAPKIVQPELAALSVPLFQIPKP